MVFLIVVNMGEDFNALVKFCKTEVIGFHFALEVFSNKKLLLAIKAAISILKQ